MAIIRIKRTTGTALPSGLTFGELAFIGATGGATANRLYIAGPEGACVWIGAEILNSPTYWSGTTAETTLATIAALEDRIVRGGGITFPGPLAVNIDTGKYFGKYTKGDTIEATGKTVKEVIEMALNETIQLGISLGVGVGNIDYGQTSGINYTVTMQYQVKTIGFTASGATLQWKRSNEGDGSWRTYPGTFFNGTAAGTTATFTATGITLNDLVGGFPNTNDFDWKYTVHDGAGTSNTITRTKVVNDTAPNNTGSLTATNTTVASPETNSVRERGRVQSDLNGTITRGSTYVPITDWKLQFSTNGGSSWSDVNAFQSVSGNPSSITIGPISHTPSNTISQVIYKAVVKTVYNTTGIDVTGSNNTVNFYYKLFYGPTASQPTTASQVRTMPLQLMSNSYSNPFTFNTGELYKDFVVALPTNIDISLQENITVLNASPEMVKSGTLTTATDAAGNSKSYNVWTLTTGTTYGTPIGQPAGQGNVFRITTTGTVA